MVWDIVGVSWESYFVFTFLLWEHCGAGFEDLTYWLCIYNFWMCITRCHFGIITEYFKLSADSWFSGIEKISESTAWIFNCTHDRPQWIRKCDISISDYSAYFGWLDNSKFSHLRHERLSPSKIYWLCLQEIAWLRFMLCTQ